ncbi:hypothetical protein Hanom_Chr07g00662931 [Helianthus anomalus]
MKMTRFQTFWIQMRKIKPLDESRRTGRKWHITLCYITVDIIETFHVSIYKQFLNYIAHV